MAEVAKAFVGVSLGEGGACTALAVAERAELQGEWDPVMFAWKKEIRLALRLVERLPMGMTFPDVVSRIRELTHQRELEGRCWVIVDATGVGAAVLDLIQAGRLDCMVDRVLLTAAQRETVERGYWMVPKRDLIVLLQVMLQKRGLQIATQMEWGKELVREMVGMRVKRPLVGKEEPGSWREGSNEDLVLAAGLACWGVGKQYPRMLTGETEYWTYADAEYWERVMRKWRP